MQGEALPTSQQGLERVSAEPYPTNSELHAQALLVDEIAYSLEGAEAELDGMGEHDLGSLNFDWIDQDAIDERLDTVLQQCQSAAAESLSDCQANILSSFDTALADYKSRLEASRSHDEHKLRKLEECAHNIVDCSEKTELQKQVQALQEACQSHERARRVAEQRVTELQSTSEVKEKEFDAALAAKQKELNVALDKVATYERANVFKQQHLQELQRRRQEHNRLIEVQGNIRVFCRVRPMQSHEDADKVAVTVGRSEEEKGLVS
jgi:hypothetical protein